MSSDVDLIVAGFVAMGRLLAQPMAELGAGTLRAAEEMKRVAILLDGGEAAVVTGADGVSRVRRVG